MKTGATIIIPPHHAHGLQAFGGFAMVALSLDSKLFQPNMPIGHRKKLRSFLELMVVRGYISSKERDVFMKAIKGVSLDDDDRGDSLSRLGKILEANPEEKVSLGAMARTTHIEKCHLIRRFKSRYGITPHVFVTQNRLRKARRDFMERHSLTESALMAGFYDQSHFIRNFKKIHGITPTKYLRACRPVETEAILRRDEQADRPGTDDVDG